MTSINTFATQNWHWLSGTTNPSIYAGYVHDFYLNTTTGAVFEKTARYVWTYRGLWPISPAGQGGDVTLNFTVADWAGDTLTVIGSGVPSPGQIGPHNIPSGKVLFPTVQIKIGTEFQTIFIDSLYDIGTNSITITKTSTYPAFDGAVLLTYGS